MPLYDYICPTNHREVEVLHPISTVVDTWGALCALAGLDPGPTDPNAPVEKKITAPRLNFPKGNSELKNMGFTKLVRRDTGIYENVTATGNESRYVDADNPATMPDFRKKIED